MQKLSAKRVPKCLNADDKRKRCQSSKQILEFFRCDPNDFLSRLVTMDETWLYHYDPETKQRSVEWRLSGSPSSEKNSECKNPLEKFSPRFFWGSRRHPPPHSLSSKGPNYRRGVVLNSAGAIEGHFEGGKKRRGKFTKRVLFLHDNAPAHRALAAQKKLAYLGFQCPHHPPYSPDLAPSDYRLFPGLKKTTEMSPFFVRRGGHCCRGDLVGRTTF